MNWQLMKFQALKGTNNTSRVNWKLRTGIFAIVVHLTDANLKLRPMIINPQAFMCKAKISSDFICSILHEYMDIRGDYDVQIYMKSLIGTDFREEMNDHVLLRKNEE